jgi:glycyl-tRNA synthetase beta chain
MAEALLELLSEEIPARMQARAAADLAHLVGGGLARQGLPISEARAFVTPRRLALVIDGLPTATADIAEERRGPRQGAPAAALEGFAKSAGIRLDQCEQKETANGVFYFATVRRPGRATALVLREVVESVLVGFPWPKSMRWGAGPARWVRPLHSILCLFAGEVVPVSFAGLTAAASTKGHRFLAGDSFTVGDFADYREKLRRARVILDQAERRSSISTVAEQAAAAAALTLNPDDGLLDEVVGLVEWPEVLIGSFDPAFRAVPEEALITAMRTHQKYFSLRQSDGQLAERFLMVANLPDPTGAILAGNQRVLRARLADARFFWESDRKIRLDRRFDQLAERLFYAGLGSMRDKALRLARLSALIAARIGADAGQAERAGLLAKADLSAEMVGEFPELQGVMGGYYAHADGEPIAVADAIAGHYAPQGPQDNCPTARVTVAVALADKLDSLVGFFAIGERPTGSKDPFALRRAALGVIRLILENGLRLPLGEIMQESHGLYASLPRDAAATRQDLMQFFAERMKIHLKERGIAHDRISAVLMGGARDDLLRIEQKAFALELFLASDDGANLLIAYRRARNICSKAGDSGAAWSGGDALEEALDQALSAASSAVRSAGEDDQAAMTAMAGLRRPVDVFFDRVLVNSDDPAERSRRLGLLGRVCEIMDQVADFSAIEGTTAS